MFIAELAAPTGALAIPLLMRKAVRWKTLPAGQRRPIFGAMVGPNELREDGEIRRLATRVCDLISTPTFYWRRIQPDSGRFDFSRTDLAVDFATQNGLPIRAHTLVWHDLLPAWLLPLDARQLSQALDSHVRAVVKRYAGRVTQWDIVNEAILPSDGQIRYMRRNMWFAKLGLRYIDLAYRVARDADPLSHLGYNEFGLEDDSSAADLKRNAVLQFLTWMRSENTPVDYLGIQGHLKPHQNFSNAKLGDFLRAVTNLGVSVHVTELDVDDSHLPADVTVRDRIVANTYGRFLAVAAGLVSSVTTWGLSDRHTWMSTAHPRADGMPSRPLPFDERMKAKESWVALSKYVAAKTR